jgi:hypothetical protein
MKQIDTILRTVVIGLILLSWSLPAMPQTTTTGKITTQGSCSPVVIQPKGGFTITCKDATLTEAESKRQAQQIAEVLSRLKASTSSNEELTLKLNDLLQSLNEVKASLSPRHISEDQRKALSDALKPFKGKNIYVYGNFSDAEALRYAQEFLDLFKAVCDSKDSIVAGRMGANQPIGFGLIVNQKVISVETIPPQCRALVDVLRSSFGIRYPLPITQGSDAPEDSCLLVVGSRT